MRLSKVTTAILLASVVSTTTISAYALDVYKSSNANTQVRMKLDEHNQKNKQKLEDKFKAQTKGYTDNITTNAEKVVEAIRVATGQEAISSTQTARADKDAKQILVAALLADAQTDAAMNAMLRFSPTMGQGYAACAVLAENSQVAQVLDTVQEQTAQKVNEIDSSPNAMAGSYNDAFKNRAAMHNDNFCTDVEGKQGSCTPALDEIQGADSNAATLMISAPAGSDVARAKQAVRQNILGSPTVAIPSSAAETAGGQAYLYAVNHKTALSAFPAYSLAYLESMSEVREDIKDADGKPQSPNDMLFNTVARYYGGKDSGEWQAAMISQQPRGLLVELAKMEGLGAWMDYQEYLAMQRMEGNLAAMTLVSAIPMEQRLRKQRLRTESQSIRDGITVR